MQEATLPIMERVKSYEDACAIAGITPLTLEQFTFLPEDQQKAMYGLHKVITVIDALNEGWKPNWNDSSEFKYYPWFYLRDQAGDVPGSGFSFVGCDDGNAGSTVGSRLCLDTSEKAEYVAEIMLQEYKDFMKK